MMERMYMHFEANALRLCRPTTSLKTWLSLSLRLACAHSHIFWWWHQCDRATHSWVVKVTLFNGRWKWW